MRIIAGPTGPGPKGMQRRGGPTAGELFRESIIRLAEKHWSTPAAAAQAFLPDLVQTIYWRELRGSGFNQRHLMLLEISQYLEKYLWKHFDPATATMEHVMSLCLMINEKFRDGIPAWDEVTGVITSEGEIEVTDRSDPAKFGGFMRRACALATNPSSPLNLIEHTRLVVFFINCFKSLENALVRQEVLPLVSLGVWAHVLESRRERELSAHPRLMKQWNLLKKKLDKMTPEEKKQREQQAAFLPKLLDRYFAVLDRTIGDGQDKKDKQMAQYCERMIEFFIDLQAQLPTRRYTNLLLDSRHVLVRSARSSLGFRAGPRGLFNQLLEMLRFYMGFEISNTTGTALTDSEMLDMHYSAIQQAQRMAFLHFPELKEFALSNVAAVDTEDALRQHLGQLEPARLQEYAAHMCLVASPDVQPIGDGELLLDIIVNALQRRPSQIEALNQMPLYPQETLLFDANSVPDEYYSEGCLALPKLNLQFLTLHDYLLRNLNLFRLESTYEIRADVIDSIKRMPAKLDADGKTQFEGWSRMALPISEFTIVEVAKPNLGEFKPSQVRADIQINLVSCRPSVRGEWDQLRKHDVLFLVSVVPRDSSQGPFRYDPKLPFPQQVGLQFVRGAEVEGFLDEDGRVIEEGFEKPVMTGNRRTIRVWLDTNQYAADMLSVQNGEPDPHECFNIVMRRKAKENNFKAVLTTIRSLMNTACLVPDWLHDVFLGYGAPSSAHYSQVDSSVTHTFNMNDTFLDIKHVRESFPDDEVYCTVPDDDPSCVPPFSITLPAKKDPEKLKEKNGTVMEEENRIVVTPFKTPNMGPYPHDQPKKNAIRFTPVQTEAIKSAMHHGLTMVVGPPGTGKTDVAVQIISNWYHNNPEERTLLVTHSNQALNQLFEKIMGLDIDERHLLRLGFGEKELATDKVFTKYGRVNYVLDRRIKLLDEVQRLADSLGVKGDVGYTCETAGHFYLYHVLAKWEAYLNKVKIGGSHHGDITAVAKEFPFTDYFATAPQPVFKGQSFEDDIEIAEGCFRHLKKMFTELEEFRAFEIMRTGPDRVNYLLVKEAKIIAMTCTHAALKREDLVKLGFNYDNVLMEEAGQILEVETFIPLMCQNPKDGRSRLKRVVMIGDHHQLPPVVKNMAFQKFSNMEQSLFTRFIRLGVPSVQLNRQGRARASIAKLYNWRYKSLGDLPHVQQRPAFQMGNAGFVHDYQLVDVPDFNGQGESEPNPYFYQNLGEAECVVATFMYMRMLGYPAEKISIITTYNGQKHLIRDVLNARCGWDPRYGLPSKVTTVDRFQGQQNDYILLSLVRTRAVGHLRDVRRLIVAMSRARLGLYVFGRRSLFEGCLELAPTFKQLCARPTQLALVPTETYPCTRPLGFLVPPQAQVAVWDTVQMHTLVDTMARTLQHQEMAREQRVAMLSARVQEMQKAGEVRAAAEAEVVKRRQEEREKRLKEEEEELERLAREQAPEEMEDGVAGEEGEEAEGEGEEGEGEGEGEEEGEGEGEGDGEEGEGEGEGREEKEAKPMEE